MARFRGRHPILRWTGVVLSLAVVAAWGGSMFWACSYGSFTIGSGILIVTSGGSGSGSAIWYAQRIPPEAAEFVSWTPEVTTLGLFGSPLTMYHVPLWIPLALIGLPTAYLWWHDLRRRIPSGHCGTCGYNLTGNTSGVCPECGRTHQA